MTRREHLGWIENVMQDRGSDGEVGDARKVVGVGRIDADQRESRFLPVPAVLCVVLACSKNRAGWRAAAD